MIQMTGKLYMYNPEIQEYVERGYGILKINESHDPSHWNRLQARLSKTFISNEIEVVHIRIQNKRSVI